MKVMLINGSPHKQGCTYTALAETAKELNNNGIETEICWVGNNGIRDCIACGTCASAGKCVFDDAVNEIAGKMSECDGLIVGSPVYYASPNGAVYSLLDRLFMSCPDLAHKPAAAVASARRAGTTATIDGILKYFTIRQMPVVSSTYWPMVHGSKPEDVMQDEEGLQTMRNLAKNMAWLIKCIDAGKKAGIDVPATETGAKTNFIR